MIHVDAYFDDATNTVTYLVEDGATQQAVLIDPVLDYEPHRAALTSQSVAPILEDIRTRGLTLTWVLDTHAHADHLSAAPYLKSHLGGKLGIGSQIKTIQRVFGEVYNIAETLSGTGEEFDHLFEDGETFQIGNIDCEALHTPGHTPACMSYRIGDAVFVGDTLFMPDFGTARCDFPGGDARTLYRSIQRLFALPDETRVFLCHDYKAPGRDTFVWETTIGDQKTGNLHVRSGRTEEDFVASRTQRDQELGMPALILPSVQVNVRAGQLPEPEANGARYLKIPLNQF